MRLSQLTTALTSTYADSAFVRDLKRAVAQTIEALADQDFSTEFDYDQCPYLGRLDVDLGDICACLDFSGYADLGPKACYKDAFGQFVELIWSQLCAPVAKTFFFGKHDDYVLDGFIKAYEASQDLFCGPVYQFIRACNALEADKYADLLSLLGPKEFVAFKGFHSLIVQYSIKAEQTADKAELDRILGK